MNIYFLMPLAAAVVLAVSSCAPTTPVGRIDRNPEIYDSLPQKQQEKVRQGHISRGMSYDAVLLAWGRPSRRLEVMKPEGQLVRWDYSGSRPVYTNHFFGGFGWGHYGHYGRYAGSGFGFGPEVTFVPYHRASVWFENDKVDGWESMQ